MLSDGVAEVATNGGVRPQHSEVGHGDPVLHLWTGLPRVGLAADSGSAFPADTVQDHVPLISPRRSTDACGAQRRHPIDHSGSEKNDIFSDQKLDRVGWRSALDTR